MLFREYDANHRMGKKTENHTGSNECLRTPTNMKKISNEGGGSVV